MATDEQIDRMRRVTALAEDDETYTDSLLGGMIDDLGFEAAAAQVWREKAAGVAAMVDTTESGSSRRLSQLRDAYEAMVGTVAPPAVTGKRSFTVEIERV